MVGEITFNYTEGPNNGSPLLLLHAQHMDWYSYSRVLPALSESYHVFAVDYHGHGKTLAPVEYNANKIGSDLAAFIRQEIGQPVFISGNSSGGLLAAWLASNEPDLIKAVVLEDPPLFSSEYPRVKDTIAYRSFTHCNNFLDSDENDFLIYWLESSTAFFERYVGANIVPLLASSIRLYRSNNPGEAVELMYLPVTVRLMIRGMSFYDPSFGAAFYDGRWNAGFDHAQALQQIQCPVMLIHANYEINDDGTLNGAMSQEEANRAAMLIPNVQYLRMNAEHVTHLNKPEEYIQTVKDFLGSIQPHNVRITAEEARRMMDGPTEYILLDVRTEEEFKKIRIDGAILIPDYDLGSRVETELPNKDMLILVYCRSGRRSANAAQELIEMGYTNVYDFGGIIDWPYKTVSG